MAKKLIDGVQDTASLASVLPAPVGTIAGMVSKGANLVEKVYDKGDALSKKISKSIPKGVGDAVQMFASSSKKKNTSASAPNTLSSVVSSREARRMARAKKRLAKRSARSDGYLKYTS